MLLLLFLIGFSDDDGFGGVAGEDLQRVVMVDEMEFQTGVFAFAIDVDPFVHVACDYDFVGFEHFDMLAELEVVGIDKGSGYGEMLDRDFVDDADVVGCRDEHHVGQVVVDVEVVVVEGAVLLGIQSLQQRR